MTDLDPRRRPASVPHALAQRLVRLSDLTETLAAFVTLHVGMVATCKPAVRLLDLVGPGITRDAEHAVKISHA